MKLRELREGSPVSKEKKKKEGKIQGRENEGM